MRVLLKPYKVILLNILRAKPHRIRLFGRNLKFARLYNQPLWWKETGLDFLSSVTVLVNQIRCRGNGYSRTIQNKIPLSSDGMYSAIAFY